MAFDTAVGGEASMSLDYLVLGNSSYALENVDVLCEEFQEEPLIMEQPEERMRYGRTILSREEFVCQCIEGQWILTKK